MKLSKLMMVIIMINIVNLTGCARDVKEEAKGRIRNYDAKEWFTKPQEIDFCHAIEIVDTNRMWKILDSGLDINTLGQVNSNRITFLAWAYLKSIPDDKVKISYQYLLEHGADPNILCQDMEIWGRGKPILVHFSVMKFAVQDFRDPFYLDLALKYGGDPNAEIEKLPLIYMAINAKSLTNVQLLAETGADINVSNRTYTPLDDALTTGYDITYYLLEKGADTKVLNNKGIVAALNLPIYTTKGEEDRQKQVEFRKKVIQFLEDKGFDLSGVTNR